jgi:hypothetical protein
MLGNALDAELDALPSLDEGLRGGICVARTSRDTWDAESGDRGATVELLESEASVKAGAGFANGLSGGGAFDS